MEASYWIYLTWEQILLGDCLFECSQLGHETQTSQTCESKWFCISTSFHIIRQKIQYVIYIWSSGRYLLVRTPAIPILPSWLVMVDWRRSPIVCDKVGSYILSVSKSCLRLPRSLVAVNSALRVDWTFLQDLSVDLWVLVEVMSFLQNF